MKLPLLNIDGTTKEFIEVSDKIVNLKVNHKLIKFVIDWQLNHSKPRTAKTQRTGNAARQPQRNTRAQEQEL